MCHMQKMRYSESIDDEGLEYELRGKLQTWLMDFETNPFSFFAFELKL